MSTPPADLPFWLALLRMPGLGASQLLSLYQKLPQLSLLFEADKSTLAEFKFSLEQREFLAHPPWAAVEKDLAWAQQDHRHILTWADPAYPTLLKETVGPPPVLFVEGRVDLLSCPQ